MPPPPSPHPSQPYHLLSVREGTTPMHLARLCAEAEARTGWLITLEGEAWHESGSRRHWLSPGTVVLLDPAKYSAGQLRAGAGWRFAAQTFAGPAAVEHARFLERKFGSLQRLPLKHSLILSVVHLARRRVDGPPLTPLEREHLAHQWHAQLHRYVLDHHLAAAAIFTIKPDDPRLLAFAGRSVKDFAQEMGCSRTFLTRKLKACWQQPPSEVLRALRVRKAATLLRESKLNLTTVAAQSGFQSLSGFFEAFRRAYGVTPGEYRARTPTGPAEAKLLFREPKRAATAPARPRATPTFRRFRDEVRAADWDGPYFRLLTCGESDRPNQTAFEIALSAVIRRLTVVITLEGEAVFETHDRSIRVTRGVAVAYPTPMNARWRTAPGVKRWRRIWLQFHGDLAEGVFKRVLAEHGNVHTITPRSEPVQLARQMIRWVRSSRNEPPVFWSQHSYRWMLAWQKYLSGRPVPPSGRVHLKVNPAAVFNAQTRSFRQYAKYLGYSLSHLSKKLKAQWNGTPGAVLRNARLDQAAELLRTTTDPVAAVARHCGYRTTSAFICAFSRRFEATPLRYRHRHRF